MNIFKKALIVALSIGLISVPTVTKEVEAATTSTDTILYLTPNSNWTQASARFAVYTWDGGEKWFDMTKSTEVTGTYEVTLPASITNIIFCRMNPSASANNWDNKWNQTADLTFQGTTNHYSVKSGTWDKGGGTWSLETPYDITYQYSDDVDDKNTVYDKLAKGIEVSVDLEKPTKEGYDFKYWKDEKGNTYNDGSNKITASGNLKLTAVWEEIPDEGKTVYYEVNGKSYHVNGVKDDVNILDVVPTTDIQKDNKVVTAWGEPEEKDGSIYIKATQYYTTFDIVDAQLAFDYTVKATSRVYLQYPQSYEDPLPVVYAYSSENTEDVFEESMNYEMDTDTKKQFYLDVPLKYDMLQFKFKLGDNDVLFPESPEKRCLDKNSSYWDNDSSKGFQHWLMNPEDYKGVTEVNNLALRLSTPDDLTYSDFEGITSFGVDYKVNNKEGTISKEYVKGNAADMFEWDVTFYNILNSRFNENIYVKVWIVVNGETITLAERNVTVVSLAEIYTSEQTGTVKEACQYIVDTYGLSA